MEAVPPGDVTRPSFIGQMLVSYIYIDDTSKFLGVRSQICGVFKSGDRPSSLWNKTPRCFPTELSAATIL